MLLFLKHRKLLFLFFLLMIFLILILQIKVEHLVQNNFVNYVNLKLLQYKIIPNIIHYVLFDQPELNFVIYLSILSSLKIQKPDFLYIHSNLNKLNGTYWDKILKLNISNTVIQLKYLSRPTHVYGQQLSSVYHSTDIARIIVLQRWGGIYLDSDVLILKNLEPFMHYDMVVGWPEKEYMGTQILLGHKNARFLSEWLRGYQRYNPTNWYYNAGEFPTKQILEKKPILAHRVKKYFGVQNLLDYLYNLNDNFEWKNYYAVHLLSRHDPAPKYMNEEAVWKAKNTFGRIARYIILKNWL